MIEGLEACAFHDVEEPRLEPGEVLLSVRHVSLCGSDLSTFKGLNPLVALPRIPGHEIGGEIEAVGVHGGQGIGHADQAFCSCVSR